MWIAKFKLKDEKDIYTPLCEKFRIEFFAYPYTHYIKDNKINLLAGGIISGSSENKRNFIAELKKDNRVKSIQQHHDFILTHAQHPLSREVRAEIEIFYNPQFIRVKPIYLSIDGWEYWELGCLDREQLNKVIMVAKKHYSGKLISLKKEKIKSIASLELTPGLTDKQLEALKVAYKEGYYSYPHSLTLPELAKLTKKSYSTFQEHLRKAEKKLIDYFLKYR